MKKLDLQDELKRLGINLRKELSDADRVKIENERDPRSIPLHTREGKEWLKQWFQDNGGLK